MKQIQKLPYYIDTVGNVFRQGKTEPLKRDISSTGYCRVTLCHYGKTYRYLVHRLVVEAYTPNPNNYEYVNHIDNDPQNCSVDNLEWCSHSQNMIHSHKQGRCSNLIASKAASIIARNAQIYKLQNLLNDRFISMIGTKRLYVSFHCVGCSKIMSCRVDSPTVTRGGSCRKCFVKMKI